jgi:hypothetical protein
MAQRVIEVRLTVEVDGNEMSHELLQRLVANDAVLKTTGEVLVALRRLTTVLEATVKVTPPEGQAELGPDVVLNLMRRANA